MTKRRDDNVWEVFWEICFVHLVAALAVLGMGPSAFQAQGSVLVVSYTVSGFIFSFLKMWSLEKF